MGCFRSGAADEAPSMQRRTGDEKVQQDLNGLTIMAKLGPLDLGKRA